MDAVFSLRYHITARLLLLCVLAGFTPGVSYAEHIQQSPAGLIVAPTAFYPNGDDPAVVSPSTGVLLTSLNDDALAATPAILEFALPPDEGVTINVTENMARLVENDFRFFPLGFYGADGGKALVKTTLVTIVPCMAGAAFSQRPVMPAETGWGMHTSSGSSPYICYENFSGLEAPMRVLRWWGVHAGWTDFTWAPCESTDPNAFTIRFYEDDAGKPGTEVFVFGVAATGVNTGIFSSGGLEIMEYTAWITSLGVDMPEGWISISGQGIGSCWFLWVNSPEGDGRIYQNTTALPYNLSLCIYTGLEADSVPRPTRDDALLVNDWVQVGRFVAGLDTFADGSEFQRADCAPYADRGDGQVLVNDWVQAGRYVAGLDAPQAQGGPTTYAKEIRR